ncbi:MAG: hypothetical protein RO009_17070 [Pseudorhodoplanes sp.]|nr:hypothetical protein [Pseudorhodoplanes sp.]
MRLFIANALAAIFALVTTAAAAWLVFVAAAPISELLQDLAAMDWRPWTLAFLLLLYLNFAFWRWSRLIVGWRLETSVRSRIAQSIAAIFGPVKDTIGYLKQVSWFFVHIAFARFLHRDWDVIIKRAAAVCAIIWITTYSILFLANLWPQGIEACAWKFPKIFACVLTRYQDLAGGVIGAGGTIFAGWLAWTAATLGQRAPDDQTQQPNNLTTVAPPQLVLLPSTQPTPSVWGRAAVIAVGIYVVAILALNLAYFAFGPTAVEDEGEISLASCTPLKDARAVVRNGDAIKSDFPIEVLNETSIVLRNSTNAALKAGKLTVRPTGYQSGAPELLYSRISTDASERNSFQVAQDASTLIVQFQALPARSAVIVQNHFSRPIGYIASLTAGEVNQRQHFGIGCDQKPELEDEESVNVVYEYLSNRCVKSGTALIQCNLRSPSQQIPAGILTADDTVEQLILQD